MSEERVDALQRGRLTAQAIRDALVSQTTLGIWAIDSDDRTAWVNPRMAEIAGYEADEMVGLSIFDVIHPDSLDAARASLAHRRSGVVEVRQAELLRPDGAVVPVHAETMPVFTDGEYAGIVAAVSDLTRRKQDEREVSMLAALVQSSSNAIIACDLEGNVKSWNPTAEALSGYRPTEIVGRSIGTILPSGAQGVVRILSATTKGDLVGPLEAEMVAKDRNHIPVELRAFPVVDDLGRIHSVAVTLRDLRARRETERLIREVERARTDVEEVGRVGTFEWRLDTGAVIWSDVVWRLHEREAGGSPAAGYLDAVDDADRERLHEAVIAAVEDHKPLDVRYRILLPSGATRWIHCHGELADADGPPRMVGTIRDVTEVAEAEEDAREAREELDRRALYDPLTSLPNRTLVLDRLAVALAHAERQNCGVAVVVTDIDRFALVNQELGHVFADQLLEAVAQRLDGIMRAGDTVGRLSGDEFAVVCENIEPHKRAVDSLAARVLDAFGEPFAVGGQEVFLVSSVGAAWAAANEPAEALLGRATAALTSAKERERGSFVVAVPGSDGPYDGRGRLALRHALREAVGTDQLRVVYQPIVELQSGEPRGLEALLRWHHPGLGPVSPLEFIPIAEDTGLILPIGQWVLGEACAALKRLAPQMSIAVNLSPRQLLQQDLPRVVSSCVLAADLDPSRLTLELTESILVEESAQVGRTLDDLKAIGVRLALDDFGTGYSALSYLKRFPFDIVKVDRTFVRGLGTDSEDGAIVGAVLGMANALGMEVVAEGIETAEQLACLSDLGAQYGQGFYFARPGPI